MTRGAAALLGAATLAALAALVPAHIPETLDALRLARRLPAMLAGTAPAEPVREARVECAGRAGLWGRSYAPSGDSAGAGADAAPPLLVLHGAAPEGADDARLVALARHLAAHGFRVVTPHFADLARFHIGTDTLAEVRSWMESFASEGGAGVLGISFSGGLALAAAGDEREPAPARYVVALGPHADLERVVRAWLTHPRDAGPGYHTPADPYGRRIFLLANLDTFVPPGDAALLRPHLEASLQRGAAPVAVDTARLTDIGRTLYDVAQGSGAVDPALAEELLAAASEPLAALSPERHGAPRCPVLLLHGRDDVVVPASESVALARHFERAGAAPRLLVTPVLMHVEGRDAGLGDRLRLLAFLRAWLIAARRR